MEKGERGTGKEGKRREAMRRRERGNGRGPDQVRKENDASCLYAYITSNMKTIGLLPVTYNV